MPYPNEHAARIKEPGEFMKDSFRRTSGGKWDMPGSGLIEVPSTIDVISGQLNGDNNPDHRHVQALRFPTKDWTPEKAENWLKEHKVKYMSFEAASGGKDKEHQKDDPSPTAQRSEVWDGERAMLTAPSTYNPESHSMHATLASETPSKVIDWERVFAGTPPYVVNEVLRADGCVLPGNRQIPMEKNHDGENIDSIVGSFRNMTMGGDNMLHGDMFFAQDDPQAERVENLYRQGHLTDLSAKYGAQESTWVPKGQKAIVAVNGQRGIEYEGPIKVTTKWQPKRAGLVSNGADITSKVRSALANPEIKKRLIAAGLPETAGEREAVDFFNGMLAQPDITVRTSTNTEREGTMPDAVNEQDVLKKERARVADIDATAAHFTGRVANIDDLKRSAIEKGTTVEVFKGIILDEQVRAGNDEDPFWTPPTTLGLTPKEVKQYSIRRAIASQIPGSGEKAEFERACSDAVAANLHQAPKGLYVPYDVQMYGMGQRAQTVTPASAGGYLVQTTVLANEFIDILRNRIITPKYGARTLTGLQGNIQIPKRTAAGTAYHIAENKAVTPSNQGLGALMLSPHEVGAREDYSNQLLLQSTPGIDLLVVDDLTKDLALLIDKDTFHGLGNTAQPLGIEKVVGVGNPTVSNPMLWTEAIGFETAVAKANADVPSMAYLTNATIVGALKGKMKNPSAGYPKYFIDDQVRADGEMIMNTYPVGRTNQINAGYIFFGDWSQVWICEWGVLDIKVDPFTAGDYNNVIVRAFQFIDVGVRQPGAFAFSSAFVA